LKTPGPKAEQHGGNVGDDAPEGGQQSLQQPGNFAEISLSRLAKNVFQRKL
jgi:hypothetical protein